MKEVYYRPFTELRIVQWRFVPSAGPDWYESNIQPVVNIITKAIPDRYWRHDEDSCTWEIASQYWPTIYVLLETRGFCLKEVDGLPEGFREFIREITLVPAAVFGPYLGLMLVLNTISHLFHSRPIPVRPWFTFILLFCCFLTVRFRNYPFLLAAICLVVLFNPIYPVHLGNWWLWQAINWATTLFILVLSVKSYEHAKCERELEYWYIYGKLARER